jgi:excisionase family DNA binding protein
MGKTWVYQRIRSGEIPSVKLGHNIKIRREDLEEYIETHTHRSAGEEVVVLEEEGEGEEDQPLP